MENVKKDVLDNGLTVLTERMPHVRSVSMGVWVKTGSRSETPELNGVAHFVEHLLFKGTRRRTAEEIAKEVDSIGGHLDAFTGKETVCYSAKVLDDHLPLAFDILSDLVLYPRFDPDEMERERSVVLEEIKMEEDIPDDLVCEIFTQNFWKNQPLGRPILGTSQTVSRLDRDRVADFFREHYTPDQLVISAAGHLDHRNILDLALRHFGHLERRSNGRALAPAKPCNPISLRTKKELEQAHVCLGVPGCALADQNRFAFYLLSTILGAGMSSRLFQNIREKQGLAYAIFSGLSSFRDTGCLLVYAGTSLKNVGRVVSSIVRELRDLKERQVGTEELRRAKDHLKGSLLLSLESSSSRMSNLARQELCFGDYKPLQETILDIDRVSADEVQALAHSVFDTPQVALTVLGNLDGVRFTRADLDCG